ncbi:hypothetical protein TWF703_007186 [Orbilia oligospora]|uniref:Uncharacterized protein n=1 Tax=Orbilia oligospora TaxID=2813651 RepID=A0A7C8P5D3_ORBOL|nr:hypothetical protein TWF703_007186 [Orbilia oligospora]
MAPVEVTRIDPPSPPRPPNPPPPSPETKKYTSLSTVQSRSRQDPPSPPRAPPPSPTKVMISRPTTPTSQSNSESSDSFPRLVELTMTLGDVLDLTPIQTSRRDSYLYCEDDMSVPGSPPPLEFSTPKPKSAYYKRRKAIDFGDNIIFLPSDPPNSRAQNKDFFGSLFSSGQLHDTGLLHEHIHGVQSCA